MVKIPQETLTLLKWKLTKGQHMARTKSVGSKKKISKSIKSKLTTRNHKEIKKVEKEIVQVFSTLVEPKKEVVCCVECDTPIPEARLKLVPVKICVDCMREREKSGQGTIRHRMETETFGDMEDIEEVRVSIVRGTK
jgi:RNA polymerase-binding transcription factor DksA